MRLGTLYFCPLTTGDVAELQESLHTYRAELFDHVLCLAQDDSLPRLLGQRTPYVYQFMAELRGLYDVAPEQFWKVINHYATTFILSRMVADDVSDPAQLNHMTGNIHAILLIERLKGNMPTTERAVYTTTTDYAGRIPGLLQEEYLHLGGEPTPNTRVTWECEAGRVTVRFPQGERAEMVLPLPLTADAPLTFEPLTKLECLHMNVFDNPTAVGMKEDEMPVNDSRYDQQEGWSPMPLTDSMTQAHRILQDLWPEALPWVKAMVPAFVDMCGPQSKRVHRSSSYGPGSPIFFTKVDNPILHAEDLIHELQHQRLFMFMDKTWFGRWNDLRQLYVSPYRSDPRPLKGLHIGLHAFLSVNEFRLRALKRGLLTEPQIYDMVKLHRMNQFSYRTIVEHEQFSAAGREFFADISRELAAQHAVIESILTPTMNEAVDRVIDRQVERVGGQIETPLNALPIYRSWGDTAQVAASYAG